MNDVDKVGGIPVVMKALLDAGLMHGDASPSPGRTMAENLEDARAARRSTTTCSARSTGRSTRPAG